MSGITVNFLGICTHMNWTATEPHFTRRTVLVNGSSGARIAENEISPHKAELRVRIADLLPGSAPPPETDDDVGVYPLRGTALSIKAPVPGDLHYEPSFRTCIPSLKMLTPILGAPSMKVVEGSEAVDAAAYVLTSSGRMHGGQTETGAAVARWKVEASTPDGVAVVMTTFGEKTGTIVVVRDGATVTIANIGDKKLDHLTDFLLHYRAAAILPVDPGLPMRAPPACEMITPHATIPHPITIGPGCSNSSYP
jgi:hypothetical protein